MGDEFNKQLTLVDHDDSGDITIRALFSSGIAILFTEKVMIHHRQVIFLQRKQRRFNGSTKIPVLDFSKLLESMGTTYCEKELTQAIKNINTGRVW
jgi:hypothetical protein